MQLLQIAYLSKKLVKLGFQVTTPGVAVAFELFHKILHLFDISETAEALH